MSTFGRNPVPKKHLPDDPFDAILRPPPDETEEQRQFRIAQEQEARRVSMTIDDSIRAEERLRKQRRIVRLLLLGQSESGKSTTLRQFQRLYTPNAFREERILWRAVVQLNLVRSIRIILDAISTPTRSASSHYPNSVASSSHRRPRRVTLQDQDTRGRPTHPQPRFNNHHHQPSHTHVYLPDFGEPASPSYSARRFEDTPQSESDHHYHHDQHPEQDHETEFEPELDDESRPESPYISPEIEAVKLRLLPVRHIEALLIAKLVPPNEDEPAHMGIGTNANGTEINSSWRRDEVYVRSITGWKGVLAKAVHLRHAESGSAMNGKGRPSDVSAEIQDEPQEVLHACRRDIMKLWQDPGVRDVLRQKKIRLQEFPGFFLNDLERVTSPRYIPSDDDVLKARLKTVGVSEYKFEMEVSAGRVRGTEWRIVDVGGSRSQATTWVPFFDDVDAIIFLAPISAFDQVLTEDRTVNRLEDSVLLWKALCSNKLLANIELVLFLNKCDILEAKLNAGIQLSRYVRSYGDRGNDVENVSKFLRSKFGAIHREYSPFPRKFYSFCTSVTDTATTAGIIASVRDMVLRQNLRQFKVI